MRRERTCTGIRARFLCEVARNAGIAIREIVTMTHAKPIAVWKPPTCPLWSTTRPASAEPSELPTFIAVDIHVRPSVKRRGGTAFCTIAVTLIIVGEMENPVKNKMTPRPIIVRAK